MFLATLLSTVCLLTAPVTAPAPVNPSVEVIRQHHLETAAGRTSFLTDVLAPYSAKAGQLNQEIALLSQTIQNLSPENDQPQILALTREATDKMTTLLAMIPALNLALSVGDDFQQIDSILDQSTPLTPTQEEIIDRIATLCNSIGAAP